MSKQIQSPGRHSSGDIAANVHNKEVETEELYRTTSSASAPEISIVLAEEEEDQKIEIDFRTGLPKLPVEPLPPGSPDTPRRLLSSALKTDMSSASSSPKRKSVTFGPATDSEDGPGSPKVCESFVNCIGESFGNCLFLFWLAWKLSVMALFQLGYPQCGWRTVDRVTKMH